MLQVSLEDITLSGRSQSPQGTREVPGVIKFPETGSRRVGAGAGPGGRRGHCCLMWPEIQFRKMEQIWEWTAAMLTQRGECTECTELFTQNDEVYAVYILPREIKNGVH